MYEKIRFQGSLPYYAQIASRDMAWQIFEQGIDPAVDPGWRLFGAKTPEDYSYWVFRACGIVCVKMCVEGFGRTNRSVHDWIHLGLARNGYLVVMQDGNLEERGWIHQSLADLMCAEGLKSHPVAASLSEIVQSIRNGNLFIASVSYELGTPNPVTFKGGHLVVVHGIDLDDDTAVTIRIHNPSGRSLALQADAAVPVERFLAAYTGRGIVVGI